MSDSVKVVSNLKLGFVGYGLFPHTVLCFVHQAFDKPLASYPERLSTSVSTHNLNFYLKASFFKSRLRMKLIL